MVEKTVEQWGWSADSMAELTVEKKGGLMASQMGE